MPACPCSARATHPLLPVTRVHVLHALLRTGSVREGHLRAGSHTPLALAHGRLLGATPQLAFP